MIGFGLATALHWRGVYLRTTFFSDNAVMSFILEVRFELGWWTLPLACFASCTEAQIVKPINQVTMPVFFYIFQFGVIQEILEPERFKSFSCLESESALDLREVLAHDVKIRFLENDDDAERFRLDVILPSALSENCYFTKEASFA